LSGILPKTQARRLPGRFFDSDVAIFCTIGASNLVAVSVVDLMNEATKLGQRRVDAQDRNFAEDEEQLHREEMLDEALQATFPASDALAVTEPGACRRASPGRRRAAA